MFLLTEARIAVKDVEPEQSSDWAGWLSTDPQLLLEGLSQLWVWVDGKLRKANSPEDASVWAAKKARIEALETRLREELLTRAILVGNETIATILAIQIPQALGKLSFRVISRHRRFCISRLRFLAN